MSEALTARNVLGAVKRHHPDDQERIRDARRRLAEAKIAEFVMRVVADAPPLSDAQRDRIGLLLRGGAG